MVRLHSTIMVQSFGPAARGRQGAETVKDMLGWSGRFLLCVLFLFEF